MNVQPTMIRSPAIPLQEHVWLVGSTRGHGLDDQNFSTWPCGFGRPFTDTPRIMMLGYGNVRFYQNSMSPNRL